MGLKREIRMSRGLRPSRWPVVLGTLLSTATLAACQTSTTGPGRVVDGLRYSVASFDVAESFPVQIGITVRIENESTTSQSVTFPDGCVVLMRAYGEGTEPAWDMGNAVGCITMLIQVDLAPGESKEYQTGLVSAQTILGEDLPNGYYRITAYLRPGEIVELDAGTTDLSVP